MKSFQGLHVHLWLDWLECPCPDYGYASFRLFAACSSEADAYVRTMSRAVILYLPGIARLDAARPLWRPAGRTFNRGGPAEIAYLSCRIGLTWFRCNDEPQLPLIPRLTIDGRSRLSILELIGICF